MLLFVTRLVPCGLPVTIATLSFNEDKSLSLILNSAMIAQCVRDVLCGNLNYTNHNKSASQVQMIEERTRILICARPVLPRTA